MRITIARLVEMIMIVLLLGLNGRIHMLLLEDAGMLAAQSSQHGLVSCPLGGLLDQQGTVEICAVHVPILVESVLFYHAQQIKHDVAGSRLLFTRPMAAD